MKYSDLLTTDFDTQIELVSELGCLANWIVKHPLRCKIASRLAADHLKAPAILPKLQAGDFAIVVGLKDHSEILETGFLLPLHWKICTNKGDTVGDDLRLPNELLEIANQVRNLFQSEIGTRSVSLNLLLNHHPANTTLKKLFADLPENFGFGSAFASMAIALKMLLLDIEPDFKTISTGSWDNDRIGTVGNIDLKTEAVRRFPYGISHPNPEGSRATFTDWFVPDGNLPQAKSAAEQSEFNRDDFKILGFDASSSTPERVLGTALASSGAAPGKNATLTELATFQQFLLEKGSTQQAEQFYRSHIFEKVNELFVLDKKIEQVEEFTLIVAVSTPAIVGICCRAFPVKKVIIVYTDQSMITRATDAMQFAEAAGVKDVELKQFDYDPKLTGQSLLDHTSSGLQKAVKDELSQTEPGKIMWELTSGLRLFTHILEKKLARKGDWMIHISQPWDATTNYRIPFTESLIVWQHGNSWD